MTLIAGIDPGASGAVGIYCTDTKELMGVHDLPFWFQLVNKKKRKRIDPIAMMELFEMLLMLDVRLVVMEANNNRPGQSAQSGFSFGYTTGLIYMACMYSKLMVETVPPQRWKKLMNVPGKATKGTKAEQKVAHDAIVMKASEIFPKNREMFMGAKGGFKMDRAEACMLAKFGGDFIYPSMKNFDLEDPDVRKALTELETGA